MRILTIVSDLGLRGTQRAAQNFSLAYKKAGHSVAVLAYKRNGPRRQALEDHSIPVFGGGVPLETALRAAERYRPHVIHVHRAGNFDPVETRILAFLCGGRRVVLETNVFGRVDYSDADRLIDVHMHVSEFCLWRWKRRLGKSRCQQVGVFVPNPLDTSAFQRQSTQCRNLVREQWGVPETAYVCGHIGYKSSGPVLSGFRKLAEFTPSAWLVCVDLPEAMRRRVNELPPAIRARVVLVDQTKNDAELASHYSAFDCLLHAPLMGETFGYVVAEALLCGVPVASLSRPHHDSGHLEVIGHEEGGLIAGCTKRFPEAVVELFRNDRLRTRVVHDGPARIKRLFDADAIADRALRIAEHARRHQKNRGGLRQALENDPNVQTSIDDQRIGDLVRNTLGGPSLFDLILMRLVSVAPVQRAVRLVRHHELMAFRP